MTDFGASVTAMALVALVLVVVVGLLVAGGMVPDVGSLGL